MRKTKDFTIGDGQYRITQLGAKEGRKIWLRLVRALTPALEQLASEPQVSDKTLVGALGALLRNIDDETTEALYETFGKTCAVCVVDSKGERWPDLTGPVFDDHFAGNYVAMSQWLGECVLFNFLPFGEGLSIGELIERVRSAGTVPSKSARPATESSTSISGVS